MRANDDVAQELAIIPGKSCTLIIFKAADKHSASIVSRLCQSGVGTVYGNIDIVQLQMTKPRLRPRHKPGHAKQYRMHDRMTIEEIYEAIDGQLHLTFDFLALTVSAAIIAGMGLLTDSSVLVVAAMLVSPLMGPILGLIFGLVVKDDMMLRKGMRNEMVGMTLTFVCGLIIGAVRLCMSPIVEEVPNEMATRGTPETLLYGVFVAIPSGVGVALSTSAGGVAALIGVAISASLLPPLVNSGMATVFYAAWQFSPVGDFDEYEQYGTIAAISMLLFLENWFIITGVAALMFKIKKIQNVDTQVKDLEGESNHDLFVNPYT